jgi:hypothetical protein
MLAVQADGSEITTVEGLANKDSLGPLQQAFKKHHALQCGFCTPGFLMTADALLRNSGRSPTAEVRQAVSGNLCRCTGYQNIVDAIVETSGAKVVPQAHHDHGPSAKFIGARVERAEDNELLSGKGVFVDDIDFPGMLHAYVVRSVHARAKIVRIDTTAAKRAPASSTCSPSKTSARCASCR